MDFFAHFTIASYALLVLSWGTILVLYLRHRRAARRVDALVASLASVLALDALKNVIESVYFGATWAALYGVAFEGAERVLQRPEVLVWPKLLNLVVAATVLVVVVRRWIPREMAERSQHLEAEAALREELASSLAEARATAERWDLALLANQDGIWDWNVVSGEAWLSPRFEAQLGYDRGELANGFDIEHWASLLHPEDRERIRRAVDDYLEGRSLEYDVELRMRAKDGSYRTFRSRGVGQRDETGRVTRMVGSHADVTEHRRAQAALERRRQIETVGLVAGGVAHDVNNLLAVIRSNAEVARASVAPDSTADRALADVEDAVTRGASLTSRLLAVSGRGQFLVSSVDLGELASETARLLASSAPEGVTLRVEVAPGLPTVRADAAQLQQVVMNLVTNAIDAVAGRGGRVIVRVREERRDAPSAGATPDGPALPPGLYVAVEVEDDGVGMTAEVQSRLFEPFFTTKPEGRGLGLSALMETLRAHRAGLQLESEEGRGTRFVLSFAAEGENATIKAPEPTVPVDEHSQLVALLVDDEPMVRRALGRIVRSLGLEAREVGSGTEALALLDAGAPIAVMLLDLTMPEMDGHEVLARARARSADLPVILCSGYHATPPASDARCGALQKPFSAAQVREALEALGVPTKPTRRRSAPS